MVIGKLLGRCNVPASADPDLQIRGGGGGHPDPDIRGMGRSKKIFFRPFGPQFGPKIRGGGPPGPLLWICHWSVKTFGCIQVKGPSRYHDFF